MDKKPQPPQHKIVRGAPAPNSLGLGDAIKRVTAAVGIKPCKACEKRAEKLNKWGEGLLRSRRGNRR